MFRAGAIWFTARTVVDKVNRLVTLADFKLARYKFPSLPDNGSHDAQALEGDITWSQTVPLDELETSLASGVVPSLERLRKEGESGRKKLNEITRYLTVPICLIQSLVVVQTVWPSASVRKGLK